MDINSSAEKTPPSSETPARPRVLSEVLNISIPTSSPRGGLLSDALGMNSPTRPRAQTEYTFFSAVTSSPRARSYSSPKALASELEMEIRLLTKVAFSMPKDPSPITVLMAEEQILTMLAKDLFESIKAKAHPLFDHYQEESHTAQGAVVELEAAAAYAEEESIFSFDRV